MRTPRRVKQRMYYALPKKLIDTYETDSEGNIIYREINGKRIATKKGKVMQYTSPSLILNSITSDLTADDLAAFGADNSGKKAKMTYRYNEYPFKAGTLIWVHSQVKYVNGEVDPTSADYTVVGIRDTGKHFWNALLSEVVK